MSEVVTITPDPQDMADLRMAMAHFERNFPGGQAKALRKGAAKVIVSMRKRTKDRKPPARARDVIDNPDHVKASGRGKNRTKSKGAKFLIVVRHQNRADTFIPTNKKSDKRRKVANMGFAESSMNHSLWRIGGGNARRAKFGKAKRFQTVDKKLNGAFQHIRIKNSVSYLQGAYPGIVENAIPTGARALVKEVNDRLDKQLARSFN